MMTNEYTDEFDIIIIGSGPGGGTLAYGLKDTNARILIIEQGKYLPQEERNWDANEVIYKRCYQSKQKWVDHTGRKFSPSSYHYVGGQSKVYGSTLIRLRERDFERLKHREGISPEWPLTYEELEPFYCRAEEIYFVHGHCGEDPTEPYRSKPFPYPPVPHEPAIESIACRLKEMYLHPFCQPVGVKYGEDQECILCRTCVLFPCKIHAKSDTEICCIKPALEAGNVELWSETRAKKLIPDSSGNSIDYLIVEREGRQFRLRAKVFIVACGAVNTPRLMLSSGNNRFPNGLANSSGLVGRNYMQHNISFLVTINPMNELNTSFEKTLAINDFYFGDEGFDYPMGHIQLAGKIDVNLVAKYANMPLVRLPGNLFERVTERVLVWSLISEDLPDPGNKVTITRGEEIQITRRPNNLVAHQRLLSKTRGILSKIGLKTVFIYRLGAARSSHYMSTMCSGNDPENSVLNKNCRTHDIRNLYVVDASFFRLQAP